MKLEKRRGFLRVFGFRFEFQNLQGSEQSQGRLFQRLFCDINPIFAFHFADDIAQNLRSEIDVNSILVIILFYFFFFGHSLIHSLILTCNCLRWLTIPIYLLNLPAKWEIGIHIRRFIIDFSIWFIFFNSTIDVDSNCIQTIVLLLCVSIHLLDIDSIHLATGF